MPLLQALAGFEAAFALLFLYIGLLRGHRSTLLFGLFSLFASLYYFFSPHAAGNEAARITALTALIGYYGVFPWYIRDLIKSRVNIFLVLAMITLTVVWLAAINAQRWDWAAYWGNYGHITIMCITIYVTISLVQRKGTLSSSLRNSLFVAITTFIVLFLIELISVYTGLIGQTPHLFGISILDYYPLLFTVIMIHALYLRARERDSLQVRLEQRDGNWQTLIDEVNLIVLKVDQSGKVLQYNAFARNKVGKSLEGSAIHDLFADGIDLGDVSRSRDTVALTLSINGTVIHGSWNVIEVSDGASDAYLILGLDQTDLVQSNKQLGESLNALEMLKEKLQKENVKLKRRLQSEPVGEMVGDSNAMQYVYTRIQQIAPTDTTVLIQGETGVGKELVANAIHAYSSRNDRPFVKLNCSAIPATLLESELFGYRKGAFTGADTDKKGMFALADKGTLFLDEIGEMPLEIQPKVLRAVQDGVFTPLGAQSESKVDARLICATNKDLLQMSQEGTFRTDLYYRLNVYPITIVPLRERKTDLPQLVEHFIEVYTDKYGKAVSEIDSQSMEQFMKYNWPGNVRELSNVIERCVIELNGEILELNEDLVDQRDLIASLTPSSGLQSLQNNERQHLLKVLESCDWQIAGTSGAASALGIPPSTLRSKMKKHGIQRP